VHKIPSPGECRGGTADLLGRIGPSSRPGECVTCAGTSKGVKAVYFYMEGEGWQNHGVAG